MKARHKSHSPSSPPSDLTGDEIDYIERSSRFFEWLGGWSYDHRWIVVSLCTLLFGLCAYLAKDVRFDNSFEAYFDSDDPVYAAYLQYREDFGSDETSFIVYEAPDYRYGPWNIEVMAKIKSLTEALESEVPFVKEVTSLANVEFMDPVPDGIRIYELLEDFPDSQAELLAMRDKMLGKPMYVGGLLTADAAYGGIIIEMEKSSIDPLDEIRLDPEGGNAIENLYPQVSDDAIEAILSRPDYEGIRFYHTGDVPLNSTLNKLNKKESGVLLGISFAVVGALLYYFFRSVVGVVGPLAVISLSLLTAMAAVGVLGWKLDIMVGMLPTLLTAVGVADSVHIIAEFRSYYAALGDRREAVRKTLYLVGTPCLLTSLTTAAGFAAMSIAPIKAISRFGIYSSVGVIAAFFLSVTLLMVFLFFGRAKREGAASERELIRAKGGERFQRALAAVAGFDIRHRKAILAVSALLFAGSVAGIAQLRIDSNFMNEYSERVPVKIATEIADRTMGGSLNMSYLFDSGVQEGVKNPAFLRDIEKLQAQAELRDYAVGKTYSIVDIIKDINQTFHEGDPAYYVLPDNRELIAQYLLLYEMSGGEEIEEYLSGDYSRATLELRTKLVDSSKIGQLVDELDAYLEQDPLEASTLEITGMGALWLQLETYIMDSQVRGFLLAFSAIALMLCVLFRSVKVGLIAMVPNLAPVVLTLGGMGWFDYPLDYVRLLIAPVAIGIAVDDTIHHLTRLRHDFAATGSYEQALYKSMSGVGRALFITSAALVLGFLVFLFSVMDSRALFGVLLATTITLALLADFFLMPALVMTLKPFGPERSGHEREAGPLSTRELP